MNSIHPAGNKLRIVISGFLLAATLSACASNPGTVPPTLAEPASQSQTAAGFAGSPSPTILWFPATATWTPFPTVAASVTPESYPGIGPEIYQDNFSSPANWSGAQAQASGSNSIIVERNRLTLAVNASPAVLASLNGTAQLTDFFAEITVTVNRCSGADTYGVLFRTAGTGNGYRFLINCTGQTRVEVIQADRTTSLQSWVASGDAPPGAPGVVKMSVWAAGDEMRFFLNERFQFRLVDRLFRQGGFGVYVNAVNPEGVNINFSNLSIHSVNFVSPTPSSTPSKTPTPSRTSRPTP